jgi:signal transduction histidine kinase
MTSPGDKECLGQDSSSIPQDADFAVLGMVSAALLHRLHNTFGILRPQLVRLRMYINAIDSDDKSSLDAIWGIVDAMERQIHSVDELIATVDVLKKPTAQPAPLDVNSLLYEVWEEFHTNRISKTVQVSLELPENVPPVRAERYLLAEVFRSILENSYEAVSEEDGRISIRSHCKQAGNGVQIEIEDNGTGIPPAILSKLFEHPLPSTGSSKGLGLWLAHLILARFGGQIEVKRTEIDHGTTIAVTIPAADTEKMFSGGDYE